MLNAGVGDAIPLHDSETGNERGIDLIGQNKGLAWALVLQSKRQFFNLRRE